MTTGVMILNFGEPSAPEREAVVSYLERIFFNSRDVEGERPKLRPASDRTSSPSGALPR